YPESPDSLTITPRIEFSDSNGYYTNLYDFDTHMELTEVNGTYIVEARGELKDRNQWEGGVAYVLKHAITDNSIEKNIKLRFHGQKPVVSIVEPIIQYKNTLFKKLDARTVEILGGTKEFEFQVLSPGVTLDLGADAERY